jgi:hypothetical protein
MPTVTQETLLGYASCPDPLCPGYEQQRAQVVRETQEFTYRELGGDSPGVERSSVDVRRFADDTDNECRYCHRQRVASDQERPQYAPISGQDPLALLHLNQQRQIHDVQAQGLERDRELAELRASLAELKAELASRPRGPGRPRKVEDAGE